MAGLFADERLGFLGTQFRLDDVHQRIPHELHRSTGLFVDLSGKGIDAGHFCGKAGHHFSTAPAPGPGRRRDVGKHRDAQGFGFPGYPHIEIGVIHRDEHVRFPLFHEAAEGFFSPNNLGRAFTTSTNPMTLYSL